MPQGNICNKVENNVGNPSVLFPGMLRSVTPEATNTQDSEVVSRLEVTDAIEPAEALTALAPDEVVVAEPSEQQADVQATVSESEAKKSGWKRTALWAAAGTVAVASTVATLVNTGFDTLKNQVLDIAPWAGAGFVASEALFVVGGAMAVAALGKKVHGIFKVRKEVEAMQKQALGGEATDGRLVDSKLFRAGFAINAAGALGTAGVAIAAATQLSGEAWGMMAPALIDIWATLALRGAVWKALKTNGKGVQ